MNIDTETTSRLRRALDDERRALAQEINLELSRQPGSGYREIIDQARDRGDESVADLYSDLDLAVTEKHLDRLRAVEAALDRMKDGSFGVCSSCGNEVGSKRLQADPAVVRCFDCQLRSESTPSAKDVTPSL